ncbi:uncharacterized protein LOC110668321 isoform X2 [Hevea brasiliensis]|uniref:uncharacterized protein LOC110668321 isoform X2 n=1 Tax=Hevea brasiliensis TaxID=3981 RepID=UPI000B76BE3B|nr:uncharacterized protein LOC110668321 isoform X2 [Hevea brasiliensis]
MNLSIYKEDRNNCARVCVSFVLMVSSMFTIICILHSTVAIACGSSIMFYLKDISVLGHGTETAQKLLGSTPHDQLLIQISNSFAAMALWRFYFERRLEDLAWHWPKQVIGDLLLALSWVFFLVYTWREKYD